MYHPAKVEERVATAQGTVFTVETWDGNLFTVDASQELDTDAVEEGAVVLIDYAPDPRFDVPSPKQVVAAVLDDEQGKQVWKRYTSLFEETQQQPTMIQPPGQGFDDGYIG